MIQEIFYDFCLNILAIFYQDYSLNNSFDKIRRESLDESKKRVYKLRNLDKNIKMSKNESFFCELFRGSIKYKIYLENFILNFESVDVFIIP